MCLHISLPQAIQDLEGKRYSQRSKNLYGKMLQALMSGPSLEGKRLQIQDKKKRP